MGQKYRAQILLEPEQHQALQKIANKEGRSISEVAREIIRIGLEAAEREAEFSWRRRMEALEQLKRIREEVSREYGTLQGNPVEEARTERERQLEQQARDWEEK
jgi:hypothetical protein